MYFQQNPFHVLILYYIIIYIILCINLFLVEINQVINHARTTKEGSLNLLSYV